MRFEITNAGPLIGFGDGPSGGHELTIDGETVAKLSRRRGGPWILVDLAGIGFDGLRFPGEVDEEALGELVVDEISRWLTENRSDLMTPRTPPRRTSPLEDHEVDGQFTMLLAFAEAAKAVDARSEIGIEERQRFAVHARGYVEGAINALASLNLIGSDEARDWSRRLNAELGATGQLDG